MNGWYEEQVQRGAEQLRRVRADLLRLEKEWEPAVNGLAATYRDSARNLLHYLALRRHDLRELQTRLSSLGLSSLGRSESCVLPTIDSVLHILHRLRDRHDPAPSPLPPGLAEGKTLLHTHTEALLGPEPHPRAVRIMVTTPGEAADDPALVRDLLAAGMDCMRINCAHDAPDAWGRMIAHLRCAEKELGKKCRVLMDLPGPKLRTGALEPGPRVVKWRPQRDLYGRVTRPARIWLTPAEAPQPAPTAADASLPLPTDWLARLHKGDRLRFVDARGASRSLRIVQVVGPSRCAASSRTAYVSTGMVLHLSRAGEPDSEATVGELPALVSPIVLKKGETLILTADAVPGTEGKRDAQGRQLTPSRIACTLPEVFPHLRHGERVWLDDGKIGGVIRRVHDGEVQVEITQARPKGEKLGADKGINFPDSNLHLPALTPTDLKDLTFVATHTDLVGLSFVHCAEDVIDLQNHLARLGGGRLGVVLKIETRRAFEQLPNVLLAAMRGPCVGVMIARGDLAVECGYERLAELQEEILWICEAAHVPVIWATQVLENLAKDGTPSRAEITDAAMGERAECVMLNKGPHILQAVRVLDDILQRMQGHQHKKRSMLRQLKMADQLALGAPVGP
jgi:pyruvate kinase